MRNTSTCLGVLLLVGLGASIGCAASGEGDDPTVGYLATEAADGGEEGKSVKVPDQADTSDDPADEEDDAGAPDDGDDDAGGGGTSDAGGGGGGGGSCGAPTTCAGASSLGEVSGDTGSDTLSRQGTTSEWLTVRVTEDNSGFLGAPLWMRATLTSPPGENFDLYVYVPSSDTRECSAVTESSKSTSSADSASVEFGEGGFGNGGDDARTVTIEVRHVSGTCSSGSKWSLLVEGNAL